MAADTEPPLTDEELHRLRQLLQADDRAVWLWSAIKVWSTWIAAVIVAVTLGWDALKRFVVTLKS